MAWRASLISWTGGAVAQAASQEAATITANPPSARPRNTLIVLVFGHVFGSGAKIDA
jgi:hypothetical protein